MSIIDTSAALVGRSLPWLPGPLLRLLGGQPRINDRGTTLSPQVQVAIASNQRMGTTLRPGTPDEVRATFKRSASMGHRPKLKPHQVEDLELAPGLPARLYRTEGPAPLVVWFHGGGFVVGDLDTTDPFCRRACVNAGVHVLSVDYRLAPEHPFPAAVDDAEAATRAAFDRMADWDATSVGVGGDSAGGNLAAATSLRLRGTPATPAFQLLVYPVVDLRTAYESQRLFARGFALEDDTIDWFMDCYSPDPASLDASPMGSADHRGLPPAVVVTAGFDPLRDEGEAYVARLRSAGVEVVHVDGQALPHGFTYMDGICPQAARATDQIFAGLRQLLG